MTEPAGLFPAHPQRPDHDLCVQGRVDIVVVYLQSRMPTVRGAVLDADTDEILGSSGTRESAVI
jgi:hypothetical protein